MEKRRIGWRGLVLGLVLLVFLMAGMANAFQPEAMVTFTFDDGSRPIYDNALPILAKHGMRAMFFGETGPLNSGEDWVVSWDEVRNLQNKYGWEIGSHSITHPYLTQVSDEQLDKELKGSKEDFAVQGITVRGFATPYGDWDNRVMSAITKYYEWNRDAWGGMNSWPFDVYHILVLEPGNPTEFAKPEEVKGWIDSAKANKQWLVLLFHEIVDGTPDPYAYNVNDFKQIVDYVAASGVKVVTISEALGLESIEPAPPAPTPPTPLPQTPNLVQNPSFEDFDSDGYAIGWWGNEGVSIDINNHGNAPEPQNSLKIVGAKNSQAAWTDNIPVSGKLEYSLRTFYNVQDIKAGGWGIWVDEFDRRGNYLGGQEMGFYDQRFVGTRDYVYRPTSSSVRWISLVIFTEARSRLTLYVDSVELRLQK